MPLVMSGAHGNVQFRYSRFISVCDINIAKAKMSRETLQNIPPGSLRSWREWVRARNLLRRSRELNSEFN